MRLALMWHPAIVTFHDSGETAEGLPYFVFEFIDGEPDVPWAGVAEELERELGPAL